MALTKADQAKLDKLQKKAEKLVVSLGEKAKEVAELEEKNKKLEEMVALQQSVIETEDTIHSEELNKVLEMFKSIDERLKKLEPKPAV